MRRSILDRAVMVLLLALVLDVCGAYAANMMIAPKVSTPPVIDGKLDEVVWSDAVISGSYVSTWELNTGGAPGVETEAWVLWDDTYIYIAFRNYQDMSALKALVTEDGGAVAGDDDNEVFVAPGWPEPRPYYQFMTNANGARTEGMGTDKTWSCDWKVATSKSFDSWVTEIAIPWSALGKAPKVGDEVGFNITRRWDKGGQWITWTPGLVSFHTPEGFSTLKLGPVLEAYGEGSPFAGWESVVGDWKAIDGAYVNSDGTEVNTSAFAEVKQEGTVLTYEWTVEFKETTFSLGPAAGLHILSDDAREAQRGNSYLIFQDKSFIRLYKSGGGRLAKVSEFPLTAAVGETHTYRVEFNTASGVMKIFRDAEEAGTWTDSSPLKSGKYVSVRTNGTIAIFRDIKVSCK